MLWTLPRKTLALDQQGQVLIIEVFFLLSHRDRIMCLFPSLSPRALLWDLHPFEGEEMALISGGWGGLRSHSHALPLAACPDPAPPSAQQRWGVVSLAGTEDPRLPLSPKPESGHRLG